LSKKTGTVNRSATGDATLDRRLLEAVHGRVWDPAEAKAEFKFKARLAPFVLVERRRDGAKGTLEYQDSPRLFYRWREDR